MKRMPFPRHVAWDAVEDPVTGVFWALCSAPLVCPCVCLYARPRCFDYRSVVICFESRKHEASNFVLLFYDFFFLAILGSIRFHTNFGALSFSLLNMLLTVALYSLPFQK